MTPATSSHLNPQSATLYNSDYLCHTTLLAMAQVPSQKGEIPFHIPSIDTPCFTFYKVFGDLATGRPPLVVLHGGPGAGHEYLLAYAELWPRYGIPVIFYDQIGCASSTHLPQTAGNVEFWQESLFISELDNLLDHLHLRDGSGFHLLGQSWGGMFGAAFAASRPRGLGRLILASALASQKLAAEGLALRRKQLPEDVQQTIDEAIQTGDYESPAFQEALALFFMKFVCRAEPFPPNELLPALKNLSDKTVYGTM